MRIAIPHHTTKERARKVIDEKLTALLNQFGGQASDVQHTWSGDTLSFKGKAKGFTVEGTMEVTNDQAILEAKLPFMAKPFEPKISAAVRKEADEMFRTA